MTTPTRETVELLHRVYGMCDELRDVIRVLNRCYDTKVTVSVEGLPGDTATAQVSKEHLNTLLEAEIERLTVQYALKDD